MDSSEGQAQIEKRGKNMKKNYLLKYAKYLGFSASLLLAVSCQKDDPITPEKSEKFDLTDSMIETNTENVVDDQEKISNTENATSKSTSLKKSDIGTLLEEIENNIETYKSNIKIIKSYMNSFSDAEKKELEPKLETLEDELEELIRLHTEAVAEYELDKTINKISEEANGVESKFAALLEQDKKVKDLLDDLEVNSPTLSDEKFSADSLVITVENGKLVTGLEEADATLEEVLAKAENLKETVEDERLDGELARLNGLKEDSKSLEDAIDENNLDLGAISFDRNETNLVKTINSLKEANEADMNYLNSDEADPTKMTDEELTELLTTYNEKVNASQKKIDDALALIVSLKEVFADDEEKLNTLAELEKTLGEAQTSLDATKDKLNEIKEGFAQNVTKLVNDFEADVNAFVSTTSSELSNEVTDINEKIQDIKTSIASASTVEELNQINFDELKAMIEAFEANRLEGTAEYGQLVDSYNSIFAIMPEGDSNADKLNNANELLNKNNPNDLSPEDNVSNLEILKEDRVKEIQYELNAAEDDKKVAEAQTEIENLKKLIEDITTEVNSVDNTVTQIENSVNSGTAVTQAEIDNARTAAEDISFANIDAKISAIEAIIAQISNDEKSDGATEELETATEEAGLMATRTKANGLKSRVNSAEEKNNELGNGNEGFTLEDLKSADFDGTSVTITADNNVCSISGNEFAIFMDNLRKVTFENPANLQVSLEINGSTLTISDLSDLSDRNIRIDELNSSTLSNSGTLTLTQLLNLFDLDKENGGYVDKYGRWIDGEKLPYNTSNNFENLRIDFEGLSTKDNDTRYRVPNILHFIGKTGTPKNIELSHSPSVDYDNSSSLEVSLKDMFTSINDPSINYETHVSGSLREMTDDMNSVDAWIHIDNITFADISGTFFGDVVDSNLDLLPGVEDILKKMAADGNELGVVGSDYNGRVKSETFNKLGELGIRKGAFENGTIVTGNEPIVFEKNTPNKGIISHVHMTFKEYGDVSGSIFYKGVQGASADYMANVYVGDNYSADIKGGKIVKLSDASTKIITTGNGEKVKVVDDEVVRDVYRDPSNGYIPTKLEDWGKLPLPKYSNPNDQAFNYLPKEFNVESVDSFMASIENDMGNSKAALRSIDEEFEKNEFEKMAALTRENQRTRA
jgi:hypothetical protein